MSKKEKQHICNRCGENLPPQAQFCPSCGAKVKATVFRKWWFWTVLAVSLILAVLPIVIIFTTSDKEPAIESASEPSTVVETSVQTTPTFIEENAEDSVTEEPIPSEYEFALRKAESCSRVMNMSKAGIYNELTAGHGETFSDEAVQYAMDNLKADWKSNARACAFDYSETFHMSKRRVYNQLKAEGEYGEGFTQEEAQYAVDRASIDWGKNAMFKALRYQKEWGLSNEQIYAMLISSEEFTEEEAKLAVDILR